MQPWKSVNLVNQGGLGVTDSTQASLVNKEVLGVLDFTQASLVNQGQLEGSLMDCSPWLVQPAFLLSSGTQSQGWHFSKWIESPNQLLIKKISYIPAYSVILKEAFFNWYFLFSY